MAQVDSIQNRATEEAPLLKAQNQSATAPIDHLAIEKGKAIEVDRKGLGPKKEMVLSIRKPSGKAIQTVPSSKGQSGRRTIPLRGHLHANGKRTVRNLLAQKVIGIKAQNALLSQVLTQRRVEIGRHTEKKVRVLSRRISKRVETDLTKKREKVRSKKISKRAEIDLIEKKERVLLKRTSKRVEIDLTKRMAIVLSKKTSKRAEIDLTKKREKVHSKRAETDLIKRMVKAHSRRTSKKETISLRTRKTENVLLLERIQMHLVALDLKDQETANSNPLLKKMMQKVADSRINS